MTTAPPEEIDPPHAAAPAPGDDGAVVDLEVPADFAEQEAAEADEPGGVEADAFSSQVARGMRWSFLSTILGRLITPITSIILARVLVPADFGVFSVAAVVMAALLSFNDLGVTNAIVWWKGDVERAARTATTLAIAASGTLYALCFLAAPFLAEGMGSAAATGVLRLLCLTAIIDGISAVPIGFLNRDFRQKQRAAADWCGFVLSTGLTIGLAVAGFGAWSLAWGRVVGNTVTTITLFVLAKQRPRPGWDSEVARVLVRYGLPACGSSFMVFAFLNVDYIVVGRMLGPAALGLYTIAFNQGSWPSNVLSTTLRRVSISTFSRLQDGGGELVATFASGLRNLMLLTLVLCAGLSGLAPALIGTLYRDEYRQAAAVLALLAILGLARVYCDFIYDLMSGIGRTRVLFVLQTVWIVVLTPAVVVGAEVNGIVGVGVAHVLVAFVVMVPAYTFVVTRTGPPDQARPSLATVITPLARPLAAAVLAAGAGRFVIGLIATPFFGLVAGGLVLLAVYGLLAAPIGELRTLPRRFLRFERFSPAP